MSRDIKKTDSTYDLSQQEQPLSILDAFSNTSCLNIYVTVHTQAHVYVKPLPPSLSALPFHSLQLASVLSSNPWVLAAVVLLLGIYNPISHFSYLSLLASNFLSYGDK